ncbi:hypothetical protein [Marinobacter zhejiangensis]|uniref:DUF2232 domain-containing protein n=1 Tax=Marinobacter zhejiangensis TaxID=488535 RepID=A0A1I4TFY7_9GAMM|nr:hypothetical protein [Marinobacter zhejiangensis]SFM75575.1 hypothetical protein SAMN04487963_3607 [Marinobacter zhejiangensis]
MRALAQFVMRGPLQAGVVAAIATAAPLLFWAGAAVVGLVILRLGISQGLSIGLWALLPAMGWAWIGQDPTALAVLLQVMLMASVLRTTLSWERALLSSGVLTIGIGLLLPVLYPQLLDQLVSAGMELYRQYGIEVSPESGSQLELDIRHTMVGSMSGMFLATAVFMTMLARSWQAGLYNPGGFRKEFHAFRLSVPVAIGCVAAVLVGPSLGLNPVLVAWAAGLPLFLAGIALVHGVVGARAMGSHWLVMFYIALVLLGPSLMFLLLVLAFVDSWLDFRGRIKPSGSAE